MLVRPLSVLGCDIAGAWGLEVWMVDTTDMRGTYCFAIICMMAMYVHIYIYISYTLLYRYGLHVKQSSVFSVFFWGGPHKDVYL